MSGSDFDFDQPSPALQGLVWTLLTLLIVGVVGLGLTWGPGFGGATDSEPVSLSNAELAKLDRVWHLVGGAQAQTPEELTADPERLAEARSLLVEVAAQSPSHPKVSFYRGLERMASGEPDAALILLKRADELAADEDPSRMAILLTLSAVLTDLKRYSEAESSLRRALEMEPDSPSVWNNLGQVLWLMGREDDSIEAYRKKLELLGLPLQPTGPV